MQITLEAFKLILGIIASVFLISFFIYYAGVYSQIQGNIQKNIILKNFLKTADDVYITGHPVTFSDFLKINEGLYFYPETSEFGFKTATLPVEIPFFFTTSGKNEFYIFRNNIDLDWYKFYYVVALPEMDIVFDTGDDDTSKSIVKGIVSLFPSTYYTQPKIRFGFCDSAERYDKYDFLTVVDSYTSSLICQLHQTDKIRIVRIGNNCQNKDGVCISPIDDSIGYVYVDNETYIYKDMLDILVLILGSGQRNVFGKLSSQLFDYKNRIFLDEIVIASKIMGARADIIANNIGQNYKISDNCKIPFREFRDKMNEIENIHKEYYKLMPNAIDNINTVLTILQESKDAYLNLVNNGCEIL